MDVVLHPTSGDAGDDAGARLRRPDSQSGKRILIADDHNVVRLGIKSIIAQQKGWTSNVRDAKHPRIIRGARIPTENSFNRRVHSDDYETHE